MASSRSPSSGSSEGLTLDEQIFAALGMDDLGDGGREPTPSSVRLSIRRKSQETLKRGSVEELGTQLEQLISKKEISRRETREAVLRALVVAHDDGDDDSFDDEDDGASSASDDEVEQSRPFLSTAGSAAADGRQKPAPKLQMHKGKAPPRRGHLPQSTAIRASILYLTAYEAEQRHEHKVYALAEDSIYSAALVLPQVARSSRWCLNFTSSAAGVALVAVLTLLLQVFMVNCLHRATIALAHTEGKPNMCTYGTEYLRPEPPRGPLGVQFAPNINNLETSYHGAVRTNILWLALNRLGQQELADLIGPVDYGIESPTCRLVCMGIFCVAVISSFRDSISAMKFLYHSPTTRSWGTAAKLASGPPQDEWVGWAISKQGPKAVETLISKCSPAHGDAKLLDAVEFKMSGMPWCWKFLWSWPMITGQFLIIFVIGYMGSRLLLSTGGILDLVLNSTALTFALELDRATLKAFGRCMAQDIMQRVKPFEKPSGRLLQHLKTHKEAIFEYNRSMLGKKLCWQCCKISATPMLVLTYYGVYLFMNCELVALPLTGDFIWPWTSRYFNDSSCLGGFDFWMGRWVSRDIGTSTGEVTCAPYRPDRPSASGCGMPADWSAVLQRHYTQGG